MAAYHGAATASATPHAVGEAKSRSTGRARAPATIHAIPTTAGATAPRGPFASRPSPTASPSAARGRHDGDASARQAARHAPATHAASGMSIVTLREKPIPPRHVAPTAAASHATRRRPVHAEANANANAHHAAPATRSGTRAANGVGPSTRYAPIAAQYTSGGLSTNRIPFSRGVTRSFPRIMSSATEA